MFVAGTRVTLIAPAGEHPAGTEGVVIYDLGDDLCQIALDTGQPLLVPCSDLAAVEAGDRAPTL